MNLLWLMAPHTELRIDALNNTTPNLADEPTLANGPPIRWHVYQTWQTNILWLMDPPNKSDDMYRWLNLVKFSDEVSKLDELVRWSAQIYRVHIGRSTGRYRCHMRTSGHSSNYDTIWLNIADMSVYHIWFWKKWKNQQVFQMLYQKTNIQ